MSPRKKIWFRRVFHDPKVEYLREYSRNIRISFLSRNYFGRIEMTDYSQFEAIFEEDEEEELELVLFLVETSNNT
jgi:hypothetical protein